MLERIVYSNADTGWTVARVSVAGRREPMTAVGPLAGARPGETVRLRGRWESDPRFGAQLRVESCVPVMPDSQAGIEKYLASGLVEGIGPVMAARLVKRFGRRTLDVIEKEPKRLAEVEGIGRVRSRRIRDAWNKQRAIRDVMVFLHSHAIPPSHAARIWRRYGDRSVALLRENPYRLSEDIHGIGFLTADRIARRMGVPSDSPQRARAGVLHSLGEAADEGHVFQPRDRLVERSAALLELPPEAIENALADLVAKARVFAEDLIEPETRDTVRAVTLASLHAAETGSARRLAEILAAAPVNVSIDAPRAVEWFESSRSLSLSSDQRTALERALIDKVLVLTGGPGTGKTMLVDAVVRILHKKRLRVSLCAPTGRAAKRLSEATACEAKTIHRLLEFNPKDGTFQRYPERPLETDALVVDEMSMVDIVLFQHLLASVPPPCRLLMVGDADQLPSVGPGNVLADLIASGSVPTTRLEEIFRQDARSRIPHNAHRINNGELPLPPDDNEDSDFFFIERDDPADALETIRMLVSRRIPARFGFDPMRDIQVLTPMQKGELGAARLNTELQALLNPPRGGAGAATGSDTTAPATPGGPGGPARGRDFRAGDRVMQTRNNYTLDVFNGDIGRIASIDAESGRASVRFDDRVLEYEQDDQRELVLAYACTVHKSQGSEYPAVVLPLHTQHAVMLRRRLLYTAVTRARRLLVIVGSRRALGLAVRSRRETVRCTALAERLAHPGP